MSNPKLGSIAQTPGDLNHVNGGTPNSGAELNPPCASLQVDSVFLVG